MCQPLDEEAITSTEKATCKSYVSVDNINVLQSVTWISDKDIILAALRDSSMPKVDAIYINDVFGEEMNGIRERAWLRFESGHLDVDSLQMATTEVEVKGERKTVRIFEMKVTPSMKNVIYSVYIIVDSSGTYLPKLSKCDCPNGWLFCSHTLACFLLVYLIQQQTDWTFPDIVAFMPPPIKSLQSVPFAASYVFGELKISKPGTKLGKKKTDDEYTRTIAKGIARDIPGYSGRYKINDADAAEESEIMRLDMSGQVKEKKSIDLCKRVDDKVAAEALRNDTNTNTTNGESKVSLATITSYNNNLVQHEPTSKATLRKLIRHERLHKMMEDGAISKNSALCHYVDHYKDDRARQIAELRNSVPDDTQLTGPKTCTNDTDYLNEYFEGYDSE